MYTEKSVIDKIEILEDGQMQIRRADKVYKDGVEIAKTYHRHVLAPGDDITKQDTKVKAVADAIWTEEVISKYTQIKEAIKEVALEK